MRCRPGVHTRIEGGGGSRHLLILWPYHLDPVAENFPLPIPDHYAEICLRVVFQHHDPRARAPMWSGCPSPWIDGGYYTKTKDNRPLSRSATD